MYTRYQKVPCIFLYRKMRKCKYFLSDLEQNQKCDKIKTVKQKLKHRNNV